MKLERLANFEPRWAARTLVLRIPSEGAGVAQLEISPEEVQLNGKTMPGPYSGIRLKTRTVPDSPPRLWLIIEDQQPVWEEIPCRNDPHLAELERVIGAWAARPEVRAAWGAEGLAQLLVPEIDAEMQQRAQMLPRSRGLAIPLINGTLVDRVRGLFQPDHQLLFFSDAGLIIRGELVPYDTITASWTTFQSWFVQTPSKTHQLVLRYFGAQARLAALVVHLSQLPSGATAAELKRLTSVQEY